MPAAAATATSCSIPDRRAGDRRRIRAGRGPATSCSWPARATSRRSSGPAGPIAWDERADGGTGPARARLWSWRLTVRGCLFTLALLVVLAVAGIWFVLPPLMAHARPGCARGDRTHGRRDDRHGLVRSAAEAARRCGPTRSGFGPTGARYHGIEAADVDVTLRDVRLVDRTGRLDGTLGSITLPGDGAPPVTIPGAVLSGTSEQVRATLTIPAAAVEQLAAAAVVAGDRDRAERGDPGRPGPGPDRARRSGRPGAARGERGRGLDARATDRRAARCGGPGRARSRPAVHDRNRSRIEEGDLTLVATLSPTTN